MEMAPQHTQGCGGAAFLATALLSCWGVGGGGRGWGEGSG